MCHDCRGEGCAAPWPWRCGCSCRPRRMISRIPQPAPTGVRTGELSDAATILKPAVLYQRAQQEVPTVPPGANCPSTPDSCAVACQLSRQQTPADGAPQGAETRALTCCRGRAARKHRAGLAPRCPRGGQAGEASGGDGSPGRKPIYQGLHHVVSPTTELPHQVGKNSLRGSGSGGPAVLMSLHPVPPVGAAVVASVIAQSYVA